MIGEEDMLKKIILPIIGIVVISFIIIKILVIPKEPSKSEAIEMFKKNLNRFTLIQEYAENTEGNLYIDNNGIFKIRVENTAGNKIEDETVIKEILHVIRKMHFVAIFENDNNILFLTKNGPVKHGLIYLKHGNMPRYKLDEKIMENWYYFKMSMP